jgi:hypothetical protein
VGFSSDSPAGVVAMDSILVTTVGPAGEGFIKVKGDRVPAGMSGSPLLDRVSGRVCGMLKASRDYASSEGGWIVPADVTVGYLPEVAAANARAHPPGEVWRDVATDRAGWTRRLFGDTDPIAAPGPPRDPRPSWWLDPATRSSISTPARSWGSCSDGAKTGRASSWCGWSPPRVGTDDLHRVPIALVQRRPGNHQAVPPRRSTEGPSHHTRTT